MKVNNYSNRRRRFYIYMSVAVLILLSAIMIKFFQQLKVQFISSPEQSVINLDTKIVSEITFICRDKFISAIPAQELLGSDFQGLLKRFPKEEGWHVDEQEANTIKISKTENQFCPLHKNYRHMGIDKGYIVLFAGPLGYNNFILQQETIKFNKLPVEWQEKFNQATSFEKQSEKNKAELRKVLEFTSDTGINELLENFNEDTR